MTAITIFPTENAQMKYYFMSLSTGRWLNRQHLTHIPLLQDLISRVHRMVWCNLSRFDVRECNRCTLLDGTNEDDDDYSTYNKTDG